MKNARYDWKRGVLPMELITRSRERRRIAIIVVALVLALLIALAYTIVSSRQATAAAVETMSEVYLQELSNQVISFQHRHRRQVLPAGNRGQLA